MKVIALWNNYRDKDVTGGVIAGEPAACWLSDSCLLREGRPFYVPGFDDDFRLFPSLVLRIDRVGKEVAERFAPRYWSEAAFWLNARACTLLRELQGRGLPVATAVAFDNSLVSAPFFPLDAEGVAAFSAAVSVNGSEVCRWSASQLVLDAPRAIAAMSRCNTLKTGDMLMLGFPEPGIKVQPGDTVSVSVMTPAVCTDTPYLMFKIK